VTGTSGTILWDNETGAAQCYRSDRGEWQIIPPPPGFERNTLFLNEAEHFLDCVAGRAEPVVTLEDGVRTLEVALAAKRSAAEARIIEMER
jgi:predicted dehydrogenase